MTVRSSILMAIALALVSLPTFGHDHGSVGIDTPYAGFEKREIKSLSEQDLDELRRGGGWGLALLAELNGRPGPAHLLELQEDLDLSPDQVEAISAIYEEMRAAAIVAGERFIAAEAALSNAFAGSELSEETLRELLEESTEARAELQFIHLSRHLSTPQILNDIQIRRYNFLRGYSDDPCASVPQGHDPERWRRHNGCG